MSTLALPTTVSDLIEEYEAKSARLPEAIASLRKACTEMDNAATVMGAWVERNFEHPTLHEDSLRKNLLKSGWRAVYNRLNVDSILSANDRKLWDKTLADPPPLTMETAVATFKDYLIRPRFHMLRGLAEVFCSLDQAYKSHSKVKIGVSGLPKRVILSWGDHAYGYGFDKFRDMVNALATLQGKPQFEWSERSAIDTAHGLGEDAVLDGRAYTKPARYATQKPETFTTIDRGLTVRKFQNGNAHIIFGKLALLDINRALAEFYGEVLPDVEPENVKPSASTAVSKDLQFYWSPPDVVAKALDYAGIDKPDDRSWRRSEPAPTLRVLEPSCGDGRILDELRERGCRSLGIEYHPGRAAECKAKGHAVLCTNFLEQPPEPVFDRVVMNPPFYGRHYIKHVEHALKFLKPGGALVAILPATARYDHEELSGEWCDLPVASFADAGTNVPTTMLRIRAKGISQ